MKNIIILLLLTLLIGSTRLAQAQQDPQFTQYTLNRLYFNPAFAGVNLETQFNFVYRSQWTGYQPSFDDGGAPNTQVVSFSTAMPKFKSGIGFHLVRDQLGPLTNIEAQLSYAYHVSLSRGATLSFGVRGGLYYRVNDYSKYRPRDADDPLVLQGTESNARPDIALGVYYQNDRLFLGAALNHLNQTKFNFGINPTISDPNITGVIQGLVINSNLMGGYSVVSTDRLEITPNFLVKMSQFRQLSFDVGSMFTYKIDKDRQIWLGLTYRDEESANAIIGIQVPNKSRKNVLQNFKFGYSFDYVFLGQNAKQPTSHEIVFSYTLPVKVSPPLPTIRTGRFRL
jgi:type IX secretion system PorP/SprF family membrane protein